MASLVTPSSSASGRSWRRCRSAGIAMVCTWSGVIASNPVSHAQAFAAASSEVEPRGLTPSFTDGEWRVARARSTM